MKTVYVCIGSACHLKGSYPVMTELTRLQGQTPPEHAYEIKAVFCLGQCTRAVSVRVDDGPVMALSPAGVAEFHRTALCAGLAADNVAETERHAPGAVKTADD